MIPVDQEFRHTPPASYGDCQRACIASLLELPLLAVPHFMHGLGDQDGDEFERRMDAFLRPLDLMHLQTQPFDFPRYAASTACFHMIYGRSARGCSHAVVAMNGKVIHDPHFDKRGLTEGDAQVWAFLVRRCGG